MLTCKAFLMQNVRVTQRDKGEIMPTVTSIMADLKKKGSEKTRKMYARHGMVTDCMFGVSIADLKVIAKTIKGQQALACELYETGNLDAMYLAGIVADGRKMTEKQLNGWAEAAAGLPMRADEVTDWTQVMLLANHSEGVGPTDWRCLGGPGRHRVQRTACLRIHRKDPGGRPGGSKAKNDPMLARTHRRRDYGREREVIFKL